MTYLQGFHDGLFISSSWYTLWGGGSAPMLAPETGISLAGIPLQTLIWINRSRGILFIGPAALGRFDSFDP